MTSDVQREVDAVVLPARGREREVTVIDGLVARLDDGYGSVLLIDGPPGIGKTRLLSEVAARTTSGGGRSLWGNGFEHQRTVPFAPLFGATLGADPPIGDAASLRALGASEDLRYWVVHDLQSAIADAAAKTPLSIAIDDAHLADVGTLAALRVLMADLSDARVLWALTARNGPIGAPVRDVVDAVSSSGADYVTHLQLSSVDPEAAADIVGDVLGNAGDASLLRLAAMARGNPFLILELLRGLREENRIQLVRGHAQAIGSVLPRRLVATMDDRLNVLSPLTRQVVEVAAVLPERFSVALIAKLLERRPAELMNAIGEAIRADLFLDGQDRLQFRHDLLRHAARDTIPHSLRRALERDSAGVLLAMGAAPEEVATQMARSAEIGDLDAVESLRWAARSLARADAAGAADISRRALDLVGQDDDLRGALVVETIDLLSRAGRFRQAETLGFEALSAEMAPEAEARIRVSLSTMPILWPVQRIAQNRAVSALARVSPTTQAHNQVWLAHNLMLDNDATAGPAALRAVAGSADVQDLDIRVLAKSTVALVELARGFGRRAATMLEGTTSVAGSLGGVSPAGQRTAVMHAFILVSLGRLREATALIAEGLAAAETEQRIEAVQSLTINQAMCDLAAGRLVAARTALEPILASQETGYSRLANVVVWAHLASAAVQLDDKSLVRRTSTAARNAVETGQNPAVRRVALCTLGHAAWQRGDVTEAARWLGRDMELIGTPMWPIDLDNVVLTARVAAATHDPAVRRHAEAALEILEREDPGAPFFVGIACHVSGLLHQDANGLDDAERILRDCERPLAHAAALEDVGHARSQLEQPQLAVVALNGAFDLYVGHGATADAHRVAHHLQVLGVNRRIVRPKLRAGWDSLTAAELRVVELVAEGATNPQAAKRLGVSPHTVNTHLRNAYAKLKINSRAQLTQFVRTTTQS
jgi:DNA-binding CsgD family transcriptional regulator